ncbi:DNA/RNA polymerase [Laetiporus sulphureus 93-53]|uniref:DNA polymerase eta n=1 Tax=Laetiporus sulphureus 93-53 TaxID=1314785 RepID=A0A165E122_9APHY|nr:DNA/RNA polymerase [Laetiporus sulphureus 93-53]KZT06045.1 DNA/RNA polymerase [Laetiporus sulphureus 93-53]
MANGAPSKQVSSVWKGKAKAAESDFDDLGPTITYRHLLSHSLGVKDPLRVVALCDSDAFYAACEQVRLGIDPTKPLVVQQWDSLIAVNYPARKFGITRMEKIKEARRKCPELLVVHVATYKEGEKEPGYWENPDTLTHKLLDYVRHQVSLDHYRRESMKIIRMFQEGLPTGEIEKASIDEAFIDFTRPVREEILRRYPHLAQVPPDAPQGLDSALPPPSPISWDGLGVVIPIDPSKPETPSNVSEPGLRDEQARVDGRKDDAEITEDVTLTTWHDVALSIAAELMGKIRSDIYRTLGYTTSAGIARNKFLAKLTASYKKPNSQTILRNAAIPNYLKLTPFQKIRFLGGKLGKAMAEEYDASTVGDLLAINLDEMQRKFGENSIWVYEILRGVDRSEVKEKSAVNKSMMASKNLLQPVTKPSQGHHWIRVLAAELALRLNEAREEMSALWPKTLVLHARKGYETGHSKQMSFPFARNVTVDLIATAGDKLWRDLIGTDTSCSGPLKITNVALGFTGVESMEAGQRSIEGFLKTPPLPDVARRSLDEAAKRKRGLHDDLEAFARSDNRARTGTGDGSHDTNTSFLCDRCSECVALPDDLAVDGVGDDIRREALAALRMEHDDFHLAQQLAMQLSSPSSSKRFRPLDKTRSEKTKRKGQSKNIATFFSGK